MINRTSTPKLDDHALYVVDIASRCIVSIYGPSSEIHDMSQMQGIPVKVGQALMHGSHLRWWARRLYERDKNPPPYMAREYSGQLSQRFPAKDSGAFLSYNPTGFFAGAGRGH